VSNSNRISDVLKRFVGQRIVARLREQTYAKAIQQEVEYVERGEGDVISRLSVDTSIVGERYVQSLIYVTGITH
jgi:ABC-type multidrug transport system fused ATPase/permease subunit